MKASKLPLPLPAAVWMSAPTRTRILAVDGRSMALLRLQASNWTWL